ncbi:hypothetical protein QCD71_23865 [Sphingomonas sp. PsM26]|nr:hypothetical protein [Sphingomonas sp. PsM26]
MTVSEYWEIKDAVMAWIRCSSAREKRRLAPDVVLQMIDYFSKAERQELAKGQISRAIRALQRGDVTSVDVHLESAFIQVSRVSVNIEWDDLRVEAEKLRKRPRREWF